MLIAFFTDLTPFVSQAIFVISIFSSGSSTFPDKNILPSITSDCIDKKYFVDEQRFGPYSLWHHKHFIEDIPNGVQMTDIVDYKLPLGFLGRFAHWLFVKKKVKSIFDYREQKLESIFGKYE